MTSLIHQLRTSRHSRRALPDSNVVAFPGAASADPWGATTARLVMNQARENRLDPAIVEALLAAIGLFEEAA